MRRSIALLIAAAAAAVVPAPPAAADVVPGTPTAETEIRNVLGRWDRARAQHDGRVLGEIMAEDFTARTADGESLDRADILAGRAPERGARMIFRDDLQIVVSGGRATTRSLATRVGTARSADEGVTTRETLVLRAGDGGWQLVSSLVNTVAQPR